MSNLDGTLSLVESKKIRSQSEERLDIGILSTGKHYVDSQ